MYITMCLYITITILRWVLSVYPLIKYYTIVVSIITIQFSHIPVYQYRNVILILNRSIHCIIKASFSVCCMTFSNKSHNMNRKL